MSGGSGSRNPTWGIPTFCCSHRISSHCTSLEFPSTSSTQWFTFTHLLHLTTSICFGSKSHYTIPNFAHAFFNCFQLPEKVYDDISGLFWRETRAADANTRYVSKHRMSSENYPITLHPKTGGELNSPSVLSPLLSLRTVFIEKSGALTLEFERREGYGID